MAGRRPLLDHRLRRGLAALCASGVVLGGLASCTTPMVTAAADSHVATDGKAAAATDVPEATGPSAKAELRTVDAAPVLAGVEAAAAGAGGTVSVVVLDADGDRLLASADAGRPVSTASLVKLLVVTRLLALDESGALTLPDEDVALAERAIVGSDDAAMSRLWDRYDGPGLVTDVAAELGLTATAPPSIPGQWGQATTSATDLAAVLAARGQLLDPGDADRLLGWLRSTSATAADGFDQRFGLLSSGTGATGPVAAKQGWMCCVDGRRQLHSAGELADGRVVVLLGDFPSSTSWARARDSLDAAAAAVLSGIG
ncbi:serine hydrolase [Geodermatophilus sp. CPCC 205761]|uniref:serine hydrolase n=1 Tax=Geodermatophilus sp. CPCC 205761 TaxID=2936597 RepID=UPI003EEDAF10